MKTEKNFAGPSRGLLTIPIMIVIQNQSTRRNENQENRWEWNSCRKKKFPQAWEWLSERMSEHSAAREPTNLGGAREQSEQWRAIKWVNLASKRTSEWPSTYIPILCCLKPLCTFFFGKQLQLLWNTTGRLLRCAHSFARSLTHSLPSSREKGSCLYIECVDFKVFLPVVHFYH